MVQLVRNVMAHAQKPGFVFPRNGRVHLNRWGRQISRLLAAEVCTSAWVMLDRPRSEVAWEYWLPTPFASFPFTSPPVRHRVPPGSERALSTNRFPTSVSKGYSRVILLSHVGRITDVERTYTNTVVSLYDDLWSAQQADGLYTYLHTAPYVSREIPLSLQATALLIQQTWSRILPSTSFTCRFSL